MQDRVDVELKGRKESDKLGHFLSLDDYMQQALFDRTSGFYEREDISNHFMTALTHIKDFSALLASYILQQNPQEVIEYGPGECQLSLAVLTNAASQPYRIIEKSHRLQLQQEKKLAAFNNISWRNQLDSSFSGIVVFHEIFDCFPAKWFVVNNREVFEKKISTQDWQPSIDSYEKCPSDALHYYSLLKNAVYNRNEISHFVYSQDLKKTIELLYDLMIEGRILIIDYGARHAETVAKWNLVSCPFRFYQHHQQIRPSWERLGECDVTYDVDFELIMYYWVQKGGAVDFYQPLNQFVAQQLQRNNNADDLARWKALLDWRLMGEDFKVLQLSK